jgi:coenzyme PQQ synthesis protein D (PqqD)
LSTVSEEQVLVRSRAVVSRVVGGETLIVPIRGKVGDLASIYSFNETGSLVWRLLEKPGTLAELVAAVAQEYNVDHPRAERDVKQFVGDMLSVGLVEVPNSVIVAGTEGPVGREGLTAAGA